MAKSLIFSWLMLVIPVLMMLFLELSEAYVIPRQEMDKRQDLNDLLARIMALYGHGGNNNSPLYMRFGAAGRK